MSDTQKGESPKRPDPANDSSRPEKPSENPQDKPKTDAPRRMRWPADFPAKH